MSQIHRVMAPGQSIDLINVAFENQRMTKGANVYKYALVDTVAAQA